MSFSGFYRYFYAISSCPGWGNLKFTQIQCTAFNLIMDASLPHVEGGKWLSSDQNLIICKLFQDRQWMHVNGAWSVESTFAKLSFLEVGWYDIYDILIKHMESMIYWTSGQAARISIGIIYPLGANYCWPFVKWLVFFICDPWLAVSHQQKWVVSVLFFFFLGGGMHPHGKKT